MTERERFVDEVMSIVTSKPEQFGRDMGEALVGMGVAILTQIGVDRADVAKSIVDGRNAS